MIIINCKYFTKMLEFIYSNPHLIMSFKVLSFHCASSCLTLVLRRGVATSPKQVFSPVLKNVQQKGKFALSSFLPLHFSKKTLNLLHTPREGKAFKVGRSGGIVTILWLNNLAILKIFEVICSQKFLSTLQLPCSNIYSKKPYKPHVPMIFFTQKWSFAYILHT